MEKETQERRMGQHFQHPTRKESTLLDLETNLPGLLSHHMTHGNLWKDQRLSRLIFSQVKLSQVPQVQIMLLHPHIHHLHRISHLLLLLVDRGVLWYLVDRNKIITLPIRMDGV